MKTLKLSNNPLLVLFLVFVCTIFFKCILFHYICFGYVAVSSLWITPTEFFAFYFSKLTPALFIASFIFITRRYWWTIIITIFIDICLIANIIYFRANDLFLDYNTILMAGNMDGFWESIFVYVSWEIPVFVLVSICYSFYVCKKHSYTVGGKWKMFFMVQIVVISLIGYDFIIGYGKKGGEAWNCNMYQGAVRIAKGECAENILMRYSWVENGTVFRYFPASILYGIAIKIYRTNDMDVLFSEKEQDFLSENVRQDTLKVSPTTNLVIVLVESLESWCISIRDIQDKVVAKNLDSLIKNKNTLYVSKVRSQAQRGSSGDGQMIINTGLLPTQNGAACMLYGENVYPNFAHFYNESYVINPAPNTWNQSVVSTSYGYKKTIIPPKITFDDAVINKMAKESLNKCKDKNFCMLYITASTHAPFTHITTNKSLHFPEEMPEVLRNYLQSVHYADSCIGDFITRLKSDSLLDNTTVVITGDHTIFKSAGLRNFDDFAREYKYPIPKNESFCPLIIISPNVKERIFIDELCYQMDIYPTIINLVGEEGYRWKGFGVNLLDSAARHNRPINESDAYILSDKIIRSNYFKDIKE